jgi:uncharacterized RDD family membrane protein YckC
MMPAALNFRAAMPILGVMNAIAQASATPVSGSKLDNRRVMAAIVDLLIVTAGAVVVLFAGDSLTGDRRGALAAVILGWALYYFFALESGEGQTVGKRLMKLRVVRADGRPAGMREVGVRTILRVVDNYLVGMIVMLATGERRQRVGDLAAGTIVVDASGLAVAPAPTPAADAVEDDEGAQVESEPVATETITLPPRPARPATAADLDEAPAVPEMRTFPPVDAPVAEEVAEVEPVAEEPVVEVEPAVEDDPVAEEPVVEVEPVAEEPVVEVEPAVEDEPVVEVPPTFEDEPVVEVAEEPVVEAEDQELPEFTSPSLEELAQDVAAAQAEPEAAPEDAEAVDDEPVNVKSVETVSAMDLIMGAAEEDAGGEDGPDSAQDAEDSASQ